MRRPRTMHATLAAALLLGGAAGPAAAELAVPPAALWRQECSACHIAYPPQMLARRDWLRLLGGLDRHFGSDASLPPADVLALRDFVERYGAPEGGRADAADGRISGTVWFRRAHAELPAGAFRDPAVKRAARCEACHSQAAQGTFRERELTPLGRRLGDD